MEPLIPSFWTSGDMSSGFPYSPYSRLAEVYMINVRFSSGGAIIFYLTTSLIKYYYLLCLSI